nr:hypothetical protein [uncultured Roseateles sp.]
MSIRLTLIASLLSATGAMAQTAPPAPPAPPAPTARPAAPDGLPPPVPYGAAVPTPSAGAVAESQATGTVVQFLLNPNGEADGLLLSDGTQIAFAPHMGRVVAQTLKVGDGVQANGWRAPGVPVLRLQTLRANGRSVTDQPPAPGAAPPAPRAEGALSELSASGRVDRLLYNDRGDVHGVLLSDKTIVRFPPHVGAALSSQLQAGGALAVRGWGTRSAQGTAIEATALGSDSSHLRALDVPPAPRRPG